MANSLIYGEPGKPSAPAAPDTRVWMYRGQEARLFQSKGEIPSGEDWRDAPYEMEPQPEVQKRRRTKAADGQELGKTDGDGN